MKADIPLNAHFIGPVLSLFDVLTSDFSAFCFNFSLGSLGRDLLDFK